VLLNHVNISQRETEVLSLLAMGARNSDIALVLDIAESSVKSILQSLYERFERLQTQDRCKSLTFIKLE
jgi:DNA-binding NarL/FixJ family response regulator